MEHDNIKSILEELIEICECEPENITVDGEPITFEGFQEDVIERVYNMADLLGLEDIYLDR
ncbi:MAG TPA: hypothetical protein IAA20_09000 [Candidatus Enterococcus avicola]|uniref:Uncharacterized protein n=1 Tax=Candidatus Enterococcus avicola TaxID=2838561 RepID=A0A9D2F7S7_9ENTE|nr:hypothetical protein [Candidatus Tetragenococcus pullicola]HIZ54065.1 hypothetical protein [Candidatus Enterococcus avicola]